MTTLPDRSYTRSEKVLRARLLMQGARQAAADADTSSYDRRIEAIDARAEARAQLVRAERETFLREQATAKARQKFDEQRIRDAAKKQARDDKVRAKAAKKYGR
ncbi:hypothetical protein [Streptomyces sp. H27-D2]|uniref:hypothetical protein n=1 Tax=Streptomyces sp. H27-D2 TaxID=3046304 RepID=UPI002DBFDFE1|nr:hypothetical protein [Streptomyces sp. H27-D2]MEC4018866.1 hypothetical protein [Streptomyces sp. H27-D2]